MLKEVPVFILFKMSLKCSCLMLDRKTLSRREELETYGKHKIGGGGRVKFSKG